MYEEPAVLATFDENELLGDAHGLNGSSFNIEDRTYPGPTRPQ